MRNFFEIFGSALLIVVFTQISIDLQMAELQIPVTGQTFAVLLVAYVFGIKKGVLAVLLYLMLSIFGVPVFAEGKSGFDTLLGNSGGFLIGFIPAAAFAGYWSKQQSNSLLNAFLAMLIGTVIILVIGVLRLSINFGIEKALQFGLFPFLPGAVIKILAGGIVGWFLRNVVHKKTASEETV